MNEEVQGATARRHRPVATAVLFTLLTLFVGGGLYSGWIFLTTVRALLTGTPPPNAPKIGQISPIDLGGIVRTGPAKSTPASGSSQRATPVPEEPLPVWDGKDRVTILLLGIDQRDDEKGLPTRSDTMILLTIDPMNLTAGMLSIPRDLWVPIRIPGHGDDKLNTAHFWGEYEKPGSGPDAARRAIQYNFGVPINYYARVDFRGFEHLIDAIGGITIDVDRAILDDEYPNEKYGVTRLYVPAGPQRMSGLVALRYARSRHADSDFGRIRRQQRVLQSAREEALTLGLIPKLPQMFMIVRNSVTTDIPWTSMLALADLGRKIQSSAIQSRQIDDSMIIDVNRDGTVLIPDRDKIRPLIQEMFYSPAVKQEAARIEVLNGTTRDGLASSARVALQNNGLNVVRIDSADRTNYRESLIVDHRGKSATTKKLASLLGVPAASVRSDDSAGSQADITVVLGNDFRGVQ